MANRTPLSRAYLSIVHQFEAAGGSGQLDQYARVKAGPTKTMMPGDTITWLRLVAAGLVAGEDDKLILTEAGRAAAQAYTDGLVRSS